MEANKIQVIDDQGNEVEFEVLFTFNNEEKDRKYVLYYDPTLEEPNVYASVYDEDGKLFEIEDPKEWEMIEEVFQTFMEEDTQAQDNSEHECCNNHGEKECCGDDECGCEN